MSTEPSTSIPSEEELKEYLEEAGLYEENMSLREKLNCYNVIRSSKSTAQQEDEQRSILESTDKNCKLLEELKENDNITISKLLQNTTQKKTDEPEEEVMVTSTPIKTTVKETLKKAVDDEEEEKEEEAEVLWDVFDCPPLKHKPLDIVSHKPKYHLPIHCDPEVLKLPFETRTKYIYNFHRILLDKFYKLHCESLNPAPWGKPIQENPKFNNASLDRKAVVISEEHEVEELIIAGNSLETSTSTEIYTSRAGRQTKRKVYVEKEEEKSKKSKRDEDDDFQIHTKSVKRPTLSKLSNAEIMKRSKLFAADSPKSSRSETIFNQLQEDDKKRRPMQKAMENFRSTLPSGSDDEDEGETERNSQETSKEVEIKPQQVSLLRRKGPASLQGRKPIRKSLTSERGKGRLPKTNTRSKSQDTSSDTSAEFQDVFLEEAAGWGEEKAKCPICSEVFSQDIIEEHASSCGLGMDTESNFENVPRGSQEMIKCAVCNKEMLFNLNYEVHVKECITKSASRNSNVS